jgi:hypothetical protein
VGARQRADLAELAEWVEGLRAAAAKARQEGKIALAEALDVTRFEVYDSYLGEELHQHSHTADDQASQQDQYSWLTGPTQSGAVSNQTAQRQPSSGAT